MSAERVWGVDTDREPKEGDMVLIPKGAWLTGTHASLPKQAGRTYRVKVNWYDAYNGIVTWRGAGGYWFRTIEWCWPDVSPVIGEADREAAKNAP